MNEIKNNNDSSNILILAAAILGGSIIFSAAYYSVHNLGVSPDHGATTPTVQPVDMEVLNRGGVALGNKNASVTVVEFSDFECPFCRVFWRDTFPALKKEYIDTGKVKFVYRNFPLSIHPMAVPYAEAALCANDQGKFWEMHDRIFGEQNKLGEGTITTTTNDDIIAWAHATGLNMTQFSQCISQHIHADQIKADAADGSTLGVEGTPTFFINGKILVGALPPSDFERVIDAALK
ncbi:MAG: DsbA family protein [Patescibacteria group bacterium]|nr:DsbA family protein [Patescibacteria group bacterium]MDE2438539.1 DsbA family protein [Patescibacteria group bacterium]